MRAGVPNAPRPQPFQRQQADAGPLQFYGGFHIDNGNNSLFPATNDRRLGQISSWYFVDDVGEDQAPMILIPKQHGKDETKAVALTVPANTLMVFNTLLWHTSSSYQGQTGQRYTYTRIYGRPPLPGPNIFWCSLCVGLAAVSVLHCCMLLGHAEGGIHGGRTCNWSPL